MLLLPVTRTWSLPAVCEAIAASDIPRHECILIVDAPGCDAWKPSLESIGFTVREHKTGGAVPPEGRYERRGRHLAMRRLSQKLVSGNRLMLCIEDDTLVPPDVWSRLSAVLESGYEAASGLQRGRHGDASCGVWKRHPISGFLRTFRPYTIASADACGHYCLMTTASAYAAAPIKPQPSEPIDIAHTKSLAPIGIDPAVFCGHLLPDGTVLL